MKKIFLTMMAGSLLLSCSQPKPAETATTEVATTPPPAEFADPKYAEIGKKGIAQLSSGDIDGWMNSFADNAVYSWSSGDSLSGKVAIASYWKDRRSNVLDQLVFKKDIWLPIKVNKPQQGPDMPGIWLMSWYQIHATYKNGKTVVMWVHSDMHFDASDKIDRFIQYIDRAPINAALAAKK